MRRLSVADRADLTRCDLSRMRPVMFEFAPKAEWLSVRLPEEVLTAVKDTSAEKGVPYQHFIRQPARTCSGRARVTADAFTLWLGSHRSVPVRDSQDAEADTRHCSPPARSAWPRVQTARGAYSIGRHCAGSDAVASGRLDRPVCCGSVSSNNDRQEDAPDEVL